MNPYRPPADPPSELASDRNKAAPLDPFVVAVAVGVMAVLGYVNWI